MTTFLMNFVILTHHGLKQHQVRLRWPGASMKDPELVEVTQFMLNILAIISVNGLVWQRLRGYSTACLTQKVNNQACKALQFNLSLVRRSRNEKNHLNGD